MKSRAHSTPSARLPSEASADAGQPRPRTEGSDSELQTPSFDLRIEPGPLDGPDTEKLLATTQELLALSHRFHRENEVMRSTIERVGEWIIAAAPLLSASGADIAGLTSIIAGHIAALKTAAQEEQSNE